MSQQPQSLESWVATRYLNDLSSSGYQPTCQNDDQPLEDALKIMASLNQATQHLKQALFQRKSNAAAHIE